MTNRIGRIERLINALRTQDIQYLNATKGWKDIRTMAYIEYDLDEIAIRIADLIEEVLVND